MQTTVQVLGFLLLVSGCAGLITLTVQAATGLYKAMDRKVLQAELVSSRPHSSNHKAAHQRLPFVLKP